ncbi:hypothetical protein E4J89_18820 [Arthrobacter sp. CAU 1506]|uniref:hypothetical protein n=1 Tax=Arthrobacter sp. CAU 1506 TaxID=2560052 RepID=UPI0010AB5976|nr:hypothetical protein [Arthrobacter sp. CAU 1506]TJY64072.1 hypothetical protein E4J89_18820 [Arthrobacter sp. CAU 1506]
MGQAVFPRLMCAIVLTFCLGACGNSAEQHSAPTEVPHPSPSVGTQKLSYPAKKVMARYKATAASFPNALPAGITFPDALPDRLLEDNYVAEAGVAEGVANFYWRCAWQDAFLTAASLNDQGAADAAFEKLATDWESLPFYQKYVEDPDRLWQSTALEPAARRDFRPLERDFHNGCRFYLEHNVHSDGRQR